MSLEDRAAPFYEQFPLRFPYREVLLHGVSEEAYENIRRGYSAIMAGLSVGSWYRSGCMPLLFFISIIGISFFIILQSVEGKMMFRARNAVIFAFRAAAKGDPDYLRFLDGDLSKIDTTPQVRIF